MTQLPMAPPAPRGLPGRGGRGIKVPPPPPPRTKVYNPENLDHETDLLLPGFERWLKYNSAKTEPAWNSSHVGVRPGILVWRVEGYKVVPRPEEMTGQFYDGDSYVILHTRERRIHHSRHVAHDIYFWLGARTTMDEASVAAYKTIELDEFLNGGTVQHREIQRAPSDAFMQIFPRMEVLSGGFRNTRPPAYALGRELAAAAAAEAAAAPPTECRAIEMKRIFKLITATETIFIVVMDVEPTIDNLNDEDVCIIDCGTKVWIWCGRSATAVEKARSYQTLYDMLLNRTVPTETVSQNDDRSGIIYGLLGAGDVFPPSMRFSAPYPMDPLSASDDGEGRPRRLFRVSYADTPSDASPGAPPPSAASDAPSTSSPDTSSFSPSSDTPSSPESPPMPPTPLTPTTQPITFTLLKEFAPMSRDDLRSSDVLLLDTGCELWVWEGAHVRRPEDRGLWLRVARAYLRSLPEEDRDAWRAPVAKVCERRENSAGFLRALLG